MEKNNMQIIIMNGNRMLIKRQKLEEYLEHATVV